MNPVAAKSTPSFRGMVSSQAGIVLISPISVVCVSMPLPACSCVIITFTSTSYIRGQSGFIKRIKRATCWLAISLDKGQADWTGAKWDRFNPGQEVNEPCIRSSSESCYMCSYVSYSQIFVLIYCILFPLLALPLSVASMTVTGILINNGKALTFKHISFIIS